MMSLQQSVPLTQVPLVAPAGRKTQLKTGAGGGSSGEEAKQGKMNQRKKTVINPNWLRIHSTIVPMLLTARRPGILPYSMLFLFISVPMVLAGSLVFDR